MLSSVDAKLEPGHPFFDLIEDAYRVFNYPKPRSTEVCKDCCMDSAIEADFFNPPIRQLPLEYIRDWYFAAYQPPGIAKQTWAYLLPRILEILAVGEEVSSIGFEVSLNRFETGNRANWSIAEWNVLDRFQRAFLDREIRRPNEFLDDFVCMFGLAGWSLDSLMSQIEAATNEELAERFWNDWIKDHIPGREGVWITAFWESPNNSKMFDFYTSKGLRDRISSVQGQTDPLLATKALAVVKVIDTAD